MASITVVTHGPLTIRTERGTGSTALRAIGDLDLVTSVALEHALLHAFESDARSIVVDLTEIRFIDSAGLRVVAWARQHAEKESDRVRIAGSAMTRRFLSR